MRKSILYFKKNILIITTLCFLAMTSKAQQESSVRTTISAFQEYAENCPVEKIYLHLDKPYYAAGEYMYLRAYLTDMHLSQENVESRIIYVELSDAKKNTFKRILLYSEENEYAGQIQLPDSLPPTTYHIRAYTNWMRNTGEDYFYHRDVYIGNTSDQQQISSSLKFDYSVSFFPEGGNLLEGFSNKVAFKALGNDGFGTEISGILSDSEGNELLYFNSLQFGMGSFEFIPEKEKKYRVTVQSDDLQKEYFLPAATEGLTMSVKQDEQSIYITLRSTNLDPEKISLVGQSRHTVCYALEGIMGGNEQLYKVEKNKFPTGIAQFTLLIDGQPVSERLVFIDRKDDLNVAIIPDKEEYGDREKVTVKIQVTDNLGQPVEGSFSLSVTDDKTVRPSINEQNIKGSLLLDSDLKGYIESPGWYFAGDEPERELALDNLLCTQGWSRFVWDKLTESSSYNYPVESDFQLTGKVTGLVGNAVKEASVIFFSRENVPTKATTDNDGRFSFYGFNCPDTTVFVLQCRTKRDKKTFIGFKFDKPDNRHAQTIMLPLLQTGNKQNRTLIEAYTEQAVRQIKFDESRWMINLPVVTVKAQKISDRQSIGMASYRFGGKTLEKSQPLDFILRSLPYPNRIERISPRSADRSRDNNLFSIPKGLYMVDGMEYTAQDFEEYFSSLPAFMFESIEVIRHEDALSFKMPSGSPGYKIKTKLFNGKHEVPDASIEIYKPEGYCVRKEFYVPEYDTPEARQNPLPDLRTAIYWNPVVRTNSSGEAEVSFYTADKVISYSYVLEGIGENRIAFSTVSTK